MRFLRYLAAKFRGQGGQSIIEALLAVAVLAIAVQATALLVRAMAKQNVSNRDRIFATEKALQMLEELRGLVLTGNATLTTLDTYSDGYCSTCTPSHPYYKWTLTTKYDATHNTNSATVNGVISGDPWPDYESANGSYSANPVRTKGYAFVRYVDIIGTTKDANVRTIYVRVYAAAANSGTAATTQTALPASPGSAPLAEVYGIVHSQGAVVTTNQVLDMYFVAIENVPGWWSRISNLIPLMQSSVASIQAINPGLVIRSHWIETMSYGRDLEYTPEINNETVSAETSGAFQKAYVYPGYVDYDYPSASHDFFLLPRWFLGRIDIGGAMPGASNFPSDAQNPNLGYAISDQFNHAMRYPDEQNLYSILCTIAQTRGIAAPQISWRMLLELLNENDPSVQNAIVLNLHGEMVPLPALRNYSDAAKDPVYYQNTYSNNHPAGARSYRVVTQPEQISYLPSQSPAVNVYAYDANPSEISTSCVGYAPLCGPAASGSDADPNESVQATLFIPGATLANLNQVIRTQGNSLTQYYRFAYSSGSGLNYYPGPTSATVVTDASSATTTGATFYADVYTPANRSVTGLRIQLFGITPTAREYNGPEYSKTPSP